MNADHQSELAGFIFSETGPTPGTLAKSIYLSARHYVKYRRQCTPQSEISLLSGLATLDIHQIAGTGLCQKRQNQYSQTEDQEPWSHIDQFRQK
jgi:hypothetical protein